MSRRQILLETIIRLHRNSSSGGEIPTCGLLRSIDCGRLNKGLFLRRHSRIINPFLHRGESERGHWAYGTLVISALGLCCRLWGVRLMVYTWHKGWRTSSRGCRWVRVIYSWSDSSGCNSLLLSLCLTMTKLSLLGRSILSCGNLWRRPAEIQTALDLRIVSFLWRLFGAKPILSRTRIWDLSFISWLL